MPFSDLRDYIARLAYEGELQRIDDEVQPVFEIGAVLRRAYELRAPSPFFTNIRGFPEWRIFSAPIGLSRRRNAPFVRFAVAMDMRPDSTAAEIVEEYLRRIAKPIPPVLVKDGPCKENILTGDSIDLQSIPAPVFHRDDGGPYIGTWHANIGKDPDNGERRWGLDRLMIHGRKMMGGLLLPEQKFAQHYYSKYEPRGRAMEFAVAIGTEPVTPCVAATRLQPNATEAEIIGALRGAPLELVKCETVDLEVPATAEIVIEGFIPPYERQKEGPFGDDSDLTGARAPRPVYHVTAITHRDHPILPVALDDVAIALSITRAAEILTETRRQGFPARSPICPPEAAIAQWEREIGIADWPKGDLFQNAWASEIQKIVQDWRGRAYRGEASE
jgi:4-hydroxy-3-polyprenylbenzoate decarboxylase